ncbi:FecR family protein [Nubsella zeaxanthinifaciens]|uniref:FecR family protein n=1 Tax=Nubsella zeaxanthinifaciens TaxID=392412 RepID=UPI003D007021
MDFTFYTPEELAANESFINYYRGINAADVEKWQLWISASPQNATQATAACELLDAVYHVPSAQEMSYERQRLLNHISNSTAPNIDNSPIPTRQFPLWVKFGLAACFALILGYFSYQYLGSSNEVIWETSTASVGKKIKLTLSDGTKVTLNSNASLRYPLKYQGETREVFLEGEAFFEVAKDKAHPFIVHSGEISTQALGTAFNVTNLPSSKEVKVSLLEGKVKVYGKNEIGQVLLNPGEQALFDKANNQLILKQGNTDQAVAWLTNTIIFNGANFDDIALAMQQYFGKKLINKSNANNWSYNSSFKNADYKTVIEAICFSKNISYVEKGDTIIVK